MPPVKLSAILEHLDTQNHETHSYLDKQTGEVFVLTDEDIHAAEGDDMDDYPAWQHESIEQTKVVLIDEGANGMGGSGRFLSLPSSFDIHEWDIMRQFAEGLENEAQSETLRHALRGRGAFRHFKDRLHKLNLADAWYKFRDDRFRQIALDWCAENNIEVDPA
ncbi:MAG: UPF0158 family protein [Phycisphaerales bacterium]|nr:UPF0158 family protein [Phycisphaerales bacterium]